MSAQVQDVTEALGDDLTEDEIAAREYDEVRNSMGAVVWVLGAALLGLLMLLAGVGGMIAAGGGI